MATTQIWIEIKMMTQRVISALNILKATNMEKPGYTVQFVSDRHRKIVLVVTKTSASDEH